MDSQNLDPNELEDALAEQDAMHAERSKRQDRRHARLLTEAVAAAARDHRQTLEAELRKRDEEHEAAMDAAMAEMECGGGGGHVDSARFESALAERDAAHANATASLEGRHRKAMNDMLARAHTAAMEDAASDHAEALGRAVTAVGSRSEQAGRRTGGGRWSRTGSRARNPAA